MSESHEAITDMRLAKEQINQIVDRLGDNDDYNDVVEKAEAINKSISDVEKTLYQTKNKSRQDPLNFPIRLNNKLAHLNSLTRMGSYKPTDQAIAFKDKITRDIDTQLSKLYAIFNEEVKQLNQKVKESQIDLIQLDK